MTGPQCENHASQTQLWRKLDLGETEGGFALQIEGQTLLVANAGDSRCVVSESGKAVAMSFDHKPTDAPEHSRIIKVGAQNSSDIPKPRTFRKDANERTI